jgi:acyl carrier protein
MSTGGFATPAAAVTPAVDHDAGLERDLAQLIVTALSLETTAEEIAPEAPLFGDGLGLDSIDALELSLAIGKAYGVQLRSDDELNHRIFASLRSLAGHIARHRTR